MAQPSVIFQRKQSWCTWMY